MSDFSDRPFAAGSLVGLRAFGVDKLGRLTSPQYGSVFRPGENVAACKRNEADVRGFYMPRLTLHYDPLPSFATIRSGNDTWHVDVAEPKPVEPMGLVEAYEEAHREQEEREKAEEARRRKEEAKRNHVIGSLDCRCGFYAYFDGSNEYKSGWGDRVSAVIEGYGVCTVGSRGFRAEKARILALVGPKRKFPTHLWALIERNYPDVPAYPTKREALEAHPLTVPDVPTPDDPDFWTRSA